ncbi:hypothetical protein PPROV_000080100 [Pycnococcus provasolii]|uniref:PHD-type domain-containing protein n=1 Tax=Pycnococcus provasolii TaxID=41880 RepID=A0A830H4S6_9CHLO|nr:hypothetical protein PPROV_000080100 [Pycnococcus provasolii]
MAEDESQQQQQHLRGCVFGNNNSGGFMVDPRSLAADGLPLPPPPLSYSQRAPFTQDSGSTFVPAVFASQQQQQHHAPFVSQSQANGHHWGTFAAPTTIRNTAATDIHNNNRLPQTQNSRGAKLVEMAHSQYLRMLQQRQGSADSPSPHEMQRQNQSADAGDVQPLPPTQEARGFHHGEYTLDIRSQQQQQQQNRYFLGSMAAPLPPPAPPAAGGTFDGDSLPPPYSDSLPRLPGNRDTTWTTEQSQGGVQTQQQHPSTSLPISSADHHHRGWLIRASQAGGEAAAAAAAEAGTRTLTTSASQLRQSFNGGQSTGAGASTMRLAPRLTAPATQQHQQQTQQASLASLKRITTEAARRGAALALGRHGYEESKKRDELASHLREQAEHAQNASANAFTQLTSRFEEMAREVAHLRAELTTARMTQQTEQRTVHSPPEDDDDLQTERREKDDTIEVPKHRDLPAPTPSSPKVLLLEWYKTDDPSSGSPQPQLSQQKTNSATSIDVDDLLQRVASIPRWAHIHKTLAINLDTHTEAHSAQVALQSPSYPKVACPESENTDPVDENHGFVHRNDDADATMTQAAYPENGATQSFGDDMPSRQVLQRKRKSSMSPASAANTSQKKTKTISTAMVANQHHHKVAVRSASKRGILIAPDMLATSDLVVPGSRVEVLWKEPCTQKDMWYTAKVLKVNKVRCAVTIEYDLDCTQESVDVRKEDVALICSFDNANSAHAINQCAKGNVDVIHEELAHVEHAAAANEDSKHLQLGADGWSALKTRVVTEVSSTRMYPGDGLTLAWDEGDAIVLKKWKSGVWRLLRGNTLLTTGLSKLDDAIRAQMERSHPSAFGGVAKMDEPKPAVANEDSKHLQLGADGWSALKTRVVTEVSSTRMYQGDGLTLAWDEGDAIVLKKWKSGVWKLLRGNTLLTTGLSKLDDAIRAQIERSHPSAFGDVDAAETDEPKPLRITRNQTPDVEHTAVANEDSKHLQLGADGWNALKTRVVTEVSSTRMHRGDGLTLAWDEGDAIVLKKTKGKWKLLRGNTLLTTSLSKLDDVIKEQVTKPHHAPRSDQAPELTAALNKLVCEVCADGGREHELILCDGCNRGCHIGCMEPPQSVVPTGEWFCRTCRSDFDFDLSQPVKSFAPLSIELSSASPDTAQELASGSSSGLAQQAAAESMRLAVARRSLLGQPARRRVWRA